MWRQAPWVLVKRSGTHFFISVSAVVLDANVTGSKIEQAIALSLRFPAKMQAVLEIFRIFPCFG